VGCWIGIECDSVEQGVGPDDAPDGAEGTRVVAASTIAAIDQRRIGRGKIDG